MNDTGIPDSVRTFLLAHVESVEQLEVLLLLRGAPDRAWSADAVNRELGSSVPSIRDRLSLLAARGFLAAVDEGEGRTAYRYEPRSEPMRQIIDALASVYRERRLAVIDLIYARPIGDAAHASEPPGRARTDEDQ